MKKSRITTRLKDKTGIAKSKNRSEDLVGLRSKYQQFSKNLKFLITTLTNNQNAMLSYSKSRLEVAKAINALTVDTPLFKCAGDIPANAVGTTDGGKDPSEANNNNGESSSSEVGAMVVAHQSNPTSYAAIHLQLHKKNKLYAAKYTEHILNYATEWERILSTRITGHIKQSEKLRVDLDHYGRKVEDLNKTMNKTMSKGKSVADSNVDKLKRNEQKLIQARQEYDRFVNDLCNFMEEVMERGWKDLHPLLVKMAQFDSTLSNEEVNLLKGSMASVTEQMKGMGARYPNLKPTGRLKELETWSLESLAKVNPSSRTSSGGLGGGGEGGGGPLMITQGGGEAASYVTGVGETGGNNVGIHAGIMNGSIVDEQLNVGGGGLFGTTTMTTNASQISLASNEGGGFGSGPPRTRNDTGDSFDWTTGQHIAAAGVVGGGGGGGMSNMSRSSSYASNRAPSSGGLPPLNPNNPRGSDISATSKMLSTMQAAAPPPTMDDIFGGGGGGGGGMAPPPAGMPPPPPSMPPPPVPQSLSPQVSALSLYDNTGGGSQSSLLQGHHQLPPPPPPAPPAAAAQMSPFMTSPSAQSMASAASTTNPFDDAFGAAAAPPAPTGGGGGGGMMMANSQPPMPHSYGGGTPTQQHNPYGGSSGASTNPFG